MTIIDKGLVTLDLDGKPFDADSFIGVRKDYMTKSAMFARIQDIIQLSQNHGPHMSINSHPNVQLCKMFMHYINNFGPNGMHVYMTKTPLDFNDGIHQISISGKISEPETKT